MNKYSKLSSGKKLNVYYFKALKYTFTELFILSLTLILKSLTIFIKKILN